MKIMTNEKVYLQLNDISQLMIYLMINKSHCPKVVFDRLFQERFVCNDDNKYDFICFEEEEAITFFKEATYIIDYNELKDYSKEELTNIATTVLEERNNVVAEFNKLPDAKKKAEQLKNSKACLLFNFKLNSIRDLVWYKQGFIYFKLPEGVEPPIDLDYKKQRITFIKSTIKRKIANFLK